MLSRVLSQNSALADGNEGATRLSHGYNRVVTIV